MNSTKTSRKKTALNWGLKIAFVFGMLYFLAKKGLLSMSETQRALTHLDQVLPAVIALFLAFIFSALRWHWLLKSQDIQLSFLRTLQLVFIGQFFNVALPGAISGDFVKAFYVAREVAGQKARAFGSILFDRIIGLSALVMVSAAALGLCILKTQDTSVFFESPLFKGIQLFVTLSALAVIVFFTYLFFVQEQHDPIHRLLNRLGSSYPRLSSVGRIYVGTRHYHHHYGTVFRSLLLSALIHISVGYSCIQFTHALGDETVSVLFLYIVIPLGLLVTAIPVAPAGVGTGHIAFSGLFQLLGSQRGADVFSFYVLVQLLLGGIGGLIYLRFKSQGQALDQSSHSDAKLSVAASPLSKTSY